MKQFRYMVEALWLRGFVYLLRMMPVSAASALCGRITQMIGPLIKPHRIALHNIATIMPELDEQQRVDMVRNMWGHLGRLFGEYPHLRGEAMMQNVVQSEGLQHIHDALETGRPIVMLSGHIGQWELLPRILSEHGMVLHGLYRPVNNPYIDRQLAEIRGAYVKAMYPKGKAAAKGMIQAMRAHEAVGILVDQKTNDGIEAEFMGSPTMSSTAVAQCVLKYDPIVIPACCIRQKDIGFSLDIRPPITFDLSGDVAQDTLAITTKVNQAIEAFVRTYPEQWFWVHKRWPFSKSVK